MVYLLLLPLALLTFLAWFSILFTGRYPKSFFEFTSGVQRWSANVFAYCALMRDEYPPFSWEPGEYPLTLDVPRADRQSRFRLFIRVFAVIPNWIVFTFIQYAFFFTTFISWWAILITGRYPRGLFKFSVGVQRWYQRQFAYLYLLRDEYPPYSINADARPGNEVLSLILGVPLFFLYIGLQLLPFAGLLGNDRQTVVVHSSLTSGALLRERPSGGANGVHVTLVEYNDDATIPSGTRRALPFGYHYVSVRVEAKHEGRWPSFFTPYFFRLHDCFDNGYSPREIRSEKGTFGFGLWWFRGSTAGEMFFEVPRGFKPCNLIYHSGRGEVHFEFP